MADSAVRGRQQLPNVKPTSLFDSKTFADEQVQQSGTNGASLGGLDTRTPVAITAQPEGAQVTEGDPVLLSFTATKAGRYPIICAELCGPYHGGMRSTVVVEDPDEYFTWVTKNSPAPLPVSATPAPSAPLQS